MIDSIGDYLAAKLKTLAFLDHVGGIARQQKIKSGEASVKTVPACRDNSQKNAYLLMVPDSKKIGIAYFENLGNSMDNALGGNRGAIYKGRIRVVVWLNLNKIAPPNTGAMMSQVVSKITEQHEGTIDVQNLSVVPAAEVPRSADIFSKYTYDEAETQFLMLPYDYFAFDFDVRYVVSSACLTMNFTKTAKEC